MPKVIKSETLAEPVTLTLAEYPHPHTVTGVEVKSSMIGRYPLTLAVATWPLCGKNCKVTDIVTMMRLADAVSHLHSLPVNADKHYGPRGRRSIVGRV